MSILSFKMLPETWAGTMIGIGKATIYSSLYAYISVCYMYISGEA